MIRIFLSLSCIPLSIPKEIQAVPCEFCSHCFGFDFGCAVVPVVSFVCKVYRVVDCLLLFLMHLNLTSCISCFLLLNYIVMPWLFKNYFSLELTRSHSRYRVSVRELGDGHCIMKGVVTIYTFVSIRIVLSNVVSYGCRHPERLFYHLVMPYSQRNAAKRLKHLFPEARIEMAE